MANYDIDFTNSRADSKNSDPLGDIKRAIKGMEDDFNRSIAQIHMGYPYYLQEQRDGASCHKE